jgi:predicted nucleotidyltransferase
MDAVIEDVPPRLRPTLGMLLRKCADDGRIRTVWLEGSLAEGSADDWSDIDLHIAVREPEGFGAIEWLDSQVHLVLSDAIPGLTGAFICLTSDWIHIDVNVHASVSDRSPDGTHRVLLDRDGFMEDSPNDQRRPGQPFFPTQDVQIFLYFLGKTVASVHRGDLIALSRATAMMRDRLLVNLLLAENGVPNESVSKRIGQHLSDEQTYCLQGIPAFGLSEISLREAQQSIAAVYLGRARKLAEKCAATWPLELEQATKRLLRDELQMSW